MISVVIPAHNEANVIGRCLTAMTRGARPGELEVIVVCNGCTDDTAAVARGFEPLVKVIETPVPSKSNALNLGDEAASGFPRFYVDADVVLALESIREVAGRLEGQEVLAAAPRVEFDLHDRRWPVRAFYQVWGNLPYCRQGMIGSGVYAVSRAGRARFDRFPQLTADDAFVRLHFKPQERLTVESCSFLVTVPVSLGGIIRIKTRSHFGNRELRRAFPHLWENESGGTYGGLFRLWRRPSLWPALAVYGYVKVASRFRARWKDAFGDARHWERDETARQTSGPVRHATTAD